MGCRYCMAACPFGVPKYEWEKAIPGVRKCIMCSKRVAAGKQTACAEICPTGATMFGDRDDLLEEAKKRIHDNPDNYLHHIFGETEVGGTSVMLLSSVGFNNFGFRNDLTERALPLYTYQVLSRIPDFVPLFGTLLGGIYWITHRREDVAEAEAEEKDMQRRCPMTVPKHAFHLLEGRFRWSSWWPASTAPSSASSAGWAPPPTCRDQFPWGLWIGFDVMCGVMLAAGGFTLTAAVEIFNIKRFHSIIRPTILTAFMGYLLVCAALMYDLGLPWNIWHPLIMRNPHSVMFEVAYCVMLYTTVLALEFSPIVLEHFNLQKPLRIVRSVMVVFVILGVLLSTLHQSSLGTLYLIMPNKLHPFWYSPLLPVFFFLSAIAVGLAMTIFESSMSSKYFGRELELPILRDLGRVLVVVLALYGILKFEDFYHRGVLRLVFVPSYEQRFFLLEIFLSVLIPLGLLLVPKIRESAQGLYLAAVLTLLGFVTNRLNVAITGVENAVGGRYTPEVDRSRDHGDVCCAGLRHLRLRGQVSAHLPGGEGARSGSFAAQKPMLQRNTRCLPMRVTDNSNGSTVQDQESPASRPVLDRLGQSISAKLMVSIFVVLVIIFGLLGYFSIRRSTQASGRCRPDQRRTAERSAAPQRLALHAEQRPRRPLRDDAEHGRPARHGAGAHHESAGRDQLFHRAS